MDFNKIDNLCNVLRCISDYRISLMDAGQKLEM